jgi:broad specificity phosphatase PhoE
MKTVRIGLIRHFEVTKPMPSGWLTLLDLTRWREAYDEAEIIPRELDLGGIEWRECFSSDLPRAYITAQAAFPGAIKQLSELREPQVLQFQSGNLKLPFGAWRWILRLAWMSSHSSQRAIKEEFMARVRALADDIIANAQEDTLIVSHAGIMAFLRKELLRLGFAGPKFGLAQNGKLYVFEKTESAGRSRSL